MSTITSVQSIASKKNKEAVSIKRTDDFIWIKNPEFDVEVINTTIIKNSTDTDVSYYFKLKFSSNYMKIVNEIPFNICISQYKTDHILFVVLQSFVSLLEKNQTCCLIITENLFLKYNPDHTSTLSYVHILNNGIYSDCITTHISKYFSIELDERLKKKLIEELKTQVIDKINHYMDVYKRMNLLI